MRTRFNRTALGILGLMLLSLLIMDCGKRYVQPTSAKSRELLGLFREKFTRVIRNAEGKIKVDIELSHRDGLYIEGDSPYVIVTVDKPAHVRLIYVTNAGEVLQKFPPPEYSEASEFTGFVSDLFERDEKHRIPDASTTFQYVATLPQHLDEAEELVLAIASTAPFSHIDSLLYEQKTRIDMAVSPSPIKEHFVSLGFLLYPEATILQWAPMVLDLIKNIFVRVKTGYQFGYNYKIVTIKR